MTEFKSEAPGAFAVYRLVPSAGGHFTYLSPNIDQIFGAEAASKQLTDWMSFIHPEDRERVFKAGENAYREGLAATSQEYRVLHPTKGEIWVESRRHTEPLPDGSMNLYLYFSDITARKKQDINLKEILDNMVEGYQVVGFDWRYKFFNETFVRHSRYSEEELRTRTVHELYPGIEKAPVYQAYLRCFAERVPIRMENEFAFPDGSIGWFDLFFQPVSQGLSILSVDITERKRQEIALRETGRMLKAAMRISGMGNFEMDLATGRVSASERMLEIYGIPAGKPFTRADIFSLIHSEDAARIWQASNAAIHGEKPFNEEYRIIREDGQQRWIYGRAELISDDHGSKRYTGAVIDITERKEIQESLKSSEERFRQVVENIEEVFWMTDTVKNTILYISPAYEKVWGRTSQSLLDSPRTWLEAIHPDDRDRVLTAALRQAEGNYNEEYRIIRPDGSICWIVDRAFPIRDADGHVYRIAGVAQDITARRKLETELSRFVEMSPTVLYAIRITKDRLESTWRSQNLATLTGHNPADPDLNRGEWWAENIHPEDRQRVIEAHPVPYEIEHQVIEYRLRKKSGAYIWIRDEKRLFRDAAGNPTEIVGSWSDITEKMQLETQMRQAQKMEAIGQLAAGVAHDFNNLLTAIRGNSDLIRSEPGLTREVREWCSDIAMATEKANHLTKQLLVVGRRQSLELQPIEINDALRQAVGLLRRVLGEDIDLRLNAFGSELKVYADPGLISQIVINLGVNARDAMPSGGIFAIECAPRELDEEMARSIPAARVGHYVCITVSDTGSGISPEIIPRIFEPFFTTKETGKGTGLGLATVFGIIQQHQGWINVYSEPGHGTTFRIYLPLIQAKVAAVPRESATHEVPRGDETVLVVEDQLSLRKLAHTILSRLGYQVLEAGTGKEALTVWEQHENRIDLVVSDVVMPDGMNGFELARQLRTRKKDLKVLFTSGYSPDLMKKQNPLAAGDHFLPKPYSLADFARLVRASLDGKKEAD